MEILQKYQKILEDGRDLSVEETNTVFNQLRQETNEKLIASFLNSWSNKGVSADELAECAKILRETVVKVPCRHEKFIDVVGTGGSRVKIFNVSTAAAFVVAGAGLPVAKHGNRAASSSTGSADVLQNLGVNIVAETEKAEKCLNEIGICFMFAPKFHNLTIELARARKSLGKPTIFNLLGPIANPANAPFQLIGVWNKDFIKPLAEACAKLGTRKTLIVHGEDGLDEITLSGKTFCAEIEKETVNYFEILPEDFGFERKPLENFNEVSPEKSAEIILSVLRNETENQAAREIVLLNAAAAIFVGGVAENYKEAMNSAKKSVMSGAALGKLNDLIEETNK